MQTRLRLAIAMALVVLGSSGPHIVLGAAVGQSPSQQPAKVWASITVNQPLYKTGDDVDVSFAAVNLSTAPMRATALREDTVLIINGKEWAGSRFAFSNGIHGGDVVQPGKSSFFLYRLTELFQSPGVYRLVWKGPDFETLPIEFRVMTSPY